MTAIADSASAATSPATGKVQRFRLREYAIARVAASQAASAGSPLSTSGRG